MRKKSGREWGKERIQGGRGNGAPAFSLATLCVHMASWKFSRFLGWCLTATYEPYLIYAPCTCYQWEANGDMGGKNLSYLDRAECGWT